MKAAACLLALALAPAAASAQTSASFRQTEHVINAGGTPLQGAGPASASYRVKLGAIGESVLGSGASSASYRADGGFVGAYPPPLEATGLRWTSRTALTWSPEKSVGTYNLYRDLLGSVAAAGTCFQSSLPTNAATDAAKPAAGQGFFYLVTARNRLREEGTKGSRSNGTLRPNASPCP